MNSVIFTCKDDFSNIAWDTNFVIVTYKDNNTNRKEIVTLKKYFELFKNKKSQKIEKFLIQSVIENVLKLLAHYNIKIKYNEVKMTFDIFENGYNYNLEEYLIILLNKAEKHNLIISKEKLMDSLIIIAKQNKYNPIQDYLKTSHKYYQMNKNNTVLQQLLDTIDSPSPFKDKYITRFLLQMIAIACSEEDSQIAAQYMLVLQGQQGIGKTTWLQNLLPVRFRSKYFLGGKVLDLNNKDHVLETITNWLCEVGEISSTFKKSDQEALKNFITAFKDKFRVPYAKEATEQKRRVTLCGTTNDSEYLKDLTGSRRFLTLYCTSINFNHNIDIDMLWGYMYDLYLRNGQYWFDMNEIQEIIKDNQTSLSKPENILIIEEFFDLFPTSETDANEDAGVWLSSSEIFKQLCLPSDCKLNKFTIGRELKKVNIKFKKDKHLGKDVFYVRKL